MIVCSSCNTSLNELKDCRVKVIVESYNPIGVREKSNIILDIREDLCIECREKLKNKVEVSTKSFLMEEVK